MKWLIAGLGLAILLFISTTVMLLYPYGLYNDAISAGMNNSYLELNKPRPELLAPKAIIPMVGESVLKKDDQAWSNFHFAHFELPLALHHHQFMLIPVIDDYEETISLGASFLNFNQREVARLRTDRSSNFRMSFFSDRLFSFPIVRNALLRKSEKQIWHDLFNLDLKLPPYSGDRLGYVRELTKIPYLELAYRIHIYKLRESLFSEGTVSFGFYPKRELGIIEIQEEGVNDSRLAAQGLEPEYANEIIFLYDKGMLHRFRLRTHLQENIGLEYRSRLIGQLSYKYSDEASSYPLYGQYRSLPRKDREDQRGMAYLFAGWSHVPDKKEYLVEMIQLLEQGKSNARHLEPLYRYAYRKYGTTFSRFAEYLRETDDQKARRLFIEKQRSETEQMINREISSEHSLEPGPDRILHYLRRAKDHGLNDDQRDSLMIQH